MSKSDSHYSNLLGSQPFDHPCALCAATHRTEQGHDPCIPDIPGVLHACCGHGYGDGYVMFENGLVLRGRFELERQAENLQMQQEWGLV